MVKQNPDLAKVQADYLFVEIAARRDALLAKEPNARLISLGIGDTTEPIPPSIVDAMSARVQALGTLEGYTGYGSGSGTPELRQSVAMNVYANRIAADEVFISDGSKCDIGRLQVLFGRDCNIALQDPAYPAYVGTSVMSGKTGGAGADGIYDGITYLPCTPGNDFAPDPGMVPEGSIIYLCSPNNPTGTVLTREQLEGFVRCAKETKSIIVFDSAYASFIQDDSLPQSIYEVEGADEVAIETGSFSKRVGFTGVRLGWLVVPKALKFEDGTSVHADWVRVSSTFFNAASNIVQAGGVATLEPEGVKEQQHLIQFYMENARILRETVQKLGYKCYGGEHTPYLWLDLDGRSSWDVFDELLHGAHIISTPGVGFGPAGEGYLRLSAFGHRADIEEAAERLTAHASSQSLR